MAQQFNLLKKKRFLPLFITQFLGALNDNMLKNAIVILITFKAAHYSSISPALMVNICAGLFILPFFIFSATSGQLADKYEKSHLIRGIKILEIIIMIVASIGFLFSNIEFLLIAIFLMGTQSTLFGPIKYSILPQHLSESEIISGNALVESGTFLAILLGTILGGILIALKAHSEIWISFACCATAVFGYLSSRHIPHALPADADLKINWNPLTETWRNLKGLKEDKLIFISIIGISWFWFYGAIFLSQLPVFAKQYLGGNEHVVTLLLAIFSIGIGIGSLLCEKLSHQKIELGLVPVGAIGLTLFTLDLWIFCPEMGPLNLGIVEFLSYHESLHTLFDLTMIGIFGGLYCIPLYAVMQIQSKPAQRSRIIAGNNIVNSAFMVFAALLAVFLLSLQFSILDIFLVVSVLNALINLIIFQTEHHFVKQFISLLFRKK